MIDIGLLQHICKKTRLGMMVALCVLPFHTHSCGGRRASEGPRIIFNNELAYELMHFYTTNSEAWATSQTQWGNVQSLKQHSMMVVSDYD